jgi:hypothetical protein
MVHVPFDTSSVLYDDFIQTGGGNDNNDQSYNYFKGLPPYQRGFGIQHGSGVGDIFRGLWRFFLPLLRRAGTAVSSEALDTGKRVLDRVTQGEPIKTSLISEAKKGADTLLEKGGLPKQFGTGRKRINRHRNPIDKHQTHIGPIPQTQIRKRLRSDAFGLY